MVEAIEVLINVTIIRDVIGSNVERLDLYGCIRVEFKPRDIS